jgi:uncharacterized protein
VIVAYQNQIVMEETLDKALERLFPTGDGGRDVRRGTPTVIRDVQQRPAQGHELLTTQAVEHYRNAMQAQRDGDWARYGEQIRQLGQVLDRMRQKP